MKKFLAVFLSLLLVASIVPTGFIMASAEGAALTAESIIEAAGFGKDKIVYSENFDSITNSPVVPHVGKEGVNEIRDGKLHIGDICYSNIGLTGTRYTDFALSMEFCSNTPWGDHYYIFHGWTGWGEFDSYFMFQYTDGSSLILKFANGGNEVTSQNAYYAGTTYNIVITSVGTTANLYVWEKGTAAPATPTLTATAATAGSGDFHVSTYAADDYIDNIKIYDSPLTTEQIATVSGEAVSDDVLSYENSFTTGGAPFTMHGVYSGTANENIGGKWHFSGAVASLTGLTNSTLSDFVISFEFTTNSGWGERFFAYHNTTGWPGSFSSDYLHFKFVDGTKFTVSLMNGGVTGTTDTVIIPGKTYNIILKSIGKTASAYIWEKGTTAPTAPTVTATAETASKGDMHIYAYEVNDYVDNIKVYDPNSKAITASQLETLTGLKIGDALYSNSFTGEDATVPVANSTQISDGTYSIVGSKWLMSGYTDSAAGMLNKSVGNFVYATELTLTDGWANTEIIFHGKDYDKAYRLIFAPNGGASSSLVQLKLGEDVYNNNIAVDLNKTYQVVITSVGKKISAYVWEKGTVMPDAPLYSEETFEAGSGDFYYYTWIGGSYFDNIQVFGLDLSPLTTAELSDLTGIELNDDVLAYANDFSDGKVPVRMHDKYQGTENTVTDGAWNIKGEYGSLTGLTGKQFTDFVYAFDTKILYQVAEFNFLTDSGYPGYCPYKLKFEWAQTGMKIGLYTGGATVAAEDNMLLDYGYICYGTDYHVVTVCENGKISVYLWAVGDAAPEDALLTATLAQPVSGDFHFYGWETDCTIDNIKVYDLYALNNDVPTLNAQPAALRSAFVSGINFDFAFTAGSANVTEFGAIIKNGNNARKVAAEVSSTDSGVTSYGIVATGMGESDVLEVMGYLVITDNNDVEHYIYSNDIKGDVEALGYKKALYGDADSNGVVNILDLVRTKKYIADKDEQVEINAVNMAFGEDIDANALADLKIVLLEGLDSIIPTDVNYVTF